jgi:hypothetical protein
MFVKSSRNKAISIGFLIAAMLITGCRNAGFRDPIAKFQSAASVVIASTRLYVTELNKVERDHYIAGQLSEKGQISLLELEKVQVFSPEGLQARLDAMDQLAAYGSLLAKLANSNAPERVTAEAQGLGEALTGLSSTVSGLTHSEDADFKSAVGPVATIVGEILGLIVEKKIKDALEKAVKQGEAPVNKLLVAIRGDMTRAYQRRQSALSLLRKTLVTEYNLEALKGAASDPEKLRLLAERVKAHEDRWENFVKANPEEGLDAMAKAHSALVTYAKSGQKVNDLSSLVEAMEAFATRAANIGRAIQALHAS